MKKYIASLIIGLLVCVTSHAATVSLYLQPSTFTNLLVGFNNPVTVSSVTVSPTNNAVTLSLIDTPTNSLTYSNAAYTVGTSYATNYINTWTNFYGVVSSTTNIALIDTTSTVAASTNSYPVRAIVTAVASTPTRYTGLSAYFGRGLWVQNNTATNAVIIVNYQ